MNIYFDIDGFYSLANKSSEHRNISVDIEHKKANELFEQYYLGLRNSILICGDTLKDETEFFTTSKKLREMSKEIALNYLNEHLKFGKVKPPDFIWIAMTAIVDELQSQYPHLESIEVILSMKPKLNPRVMNKNKIYFPALSRTLLNQYNLVLISSILSEINEEGVLQKKADIQHIARLTIPYFLFCHDNFSVRNLPISIPFSTEAIDKAFKLTNLQILFILAHEYGHILLNHKYTTEPKQRMDAEKEADLFALSIILGYVKKNDSYSMHDVFISIRWLFKYQLLEESIGLLVRGIPLNFKDIPSEIRRGNIQMEFIKMTGIKQSTVLESQGFLTLVELQTILYKEGTDFINFVILKIKESQNNGIVEPWWKKIKTE